MSSTEDSLLEAELQAWSAWTQGDTASAAVLVAATVAADATCLWANRLQVHLCWHRRDLPEALSAAEAAVASGGQAEDHKLRAVIRYKLGDARGALEDFDTCLALDPRLAPQVRSMREQCVATLSTDQGALRWRASQAVDRGAWAQAQALLESIPQRGAADLQVLGRCREALGDLEGARRDYERAIELEPTWVLAWHGLSRTWLETDPRRAASEASRGLGHVPGDIILLCTRATAWQRLGDHQAALADAEQACELSPRDDWAHVLRARSLLSLGREDEARRALMAARAAGLRAPFLEEAAELQHYPDSHR